MKKLVLWVCIALMTWAVGAQDTAETVETAPVTGSAPTDVSLDPDTATLGELGSIVVNVSYADVDGDASRFVWTVVDTNMEYYTLPEGMFSQAMNGTTIPALFVCAEPGYTAEILLNVVDVQGNISEPATFTLICDGELTATPAEDATENTTETSAEFATAVNVGSAPVVLGFEPETLTLTEYTEASVKVMYEDADGDAVRFIWSMTDTDALTYDLPEGRFDQQTIGTEIPVTFFCTTAEFYADIALVIEDAEGNQSAPTVFKVTCE